MVRLTRSRVTFFESCLGFGAHLKRMGNLLSSGRLIYSHERGGWLEFESGEVTNSWNIWLRAQDRTDAG
jgi:hypothetical protein